MAVICTLVAQVLVTVRFGARFVLNDPSFILIIGNFRGRIFAVSMRNNSVAFGFASITVSQLVLGIWMITLAVKKGGE